MTLRDLTGVIGGLSSTEEEVAVFDAAGDPCFISPKLTATCERVRECDK